MNSYTTYLFIFLCSFFYANVTAQEQTPLWMLEIIDDIVEETDLCERCIWQSPAFTYTNFNGRIRYFLRYSCSISDGFTRMYDESGTVIGECITQDGESNCGFGANANTIYTFSEIIVPVWNCQTGFECELAVANNLNQEVPITIDDSRCAEGIKILNASNEFESYNWSGSAITDNTSSSIEITQEGTYEVTVTDLNGCTKTGSVTIDDIEVLNLVIKGPSSVCPNGEATLLAAPFESYQWSSGASDSEIIVNQAGIYTITVTNEANCQGTASFSLEEFSSSDISIETNTSTIKAGEKLELALSMTNSNTSIASQEWLGDGTFTCSDCPATTFRPFISGNVRVTVMDNRGCINTAQLFIQVEELPLEIYAPNVFAPKGNGANTNFTIFGGTNVQEIEELAIFDRWGNLLFQNNDFTPNQVNLGWDGRYKGQFVQQDVYLYIAKVHFSNGVMKIFSGDILVLY